MPTLEDYMLARSKEDIEYPIDFAGQQWYTGDYYMQTYGLTKGQLRAMATYQGADTFRFDDVTFFANLEPKVHFTRSLERNQKVLWSIGALPEDESWALITRYAIQIRYGICNMLRQTGVLLNDAYRVYDKPQYDRKRASHMHDNVDNYSGYSTRELIRKFKV